MKRIGAAVLLVLVGGAGPIVARTASPARAIPAACPAGGQVVTAGTALQPLLDRAPDGAILCLDPGDYRGPIDVRTSIVVQGPSDAIIHSDGAGTTVRLLAPGAELRGVTVDGSGQRAETSDSAVYVRGDRIAVRGVTVRRAFFGLLAERSSGVIFDGNHIVGDAAVAPGLRGDGIHLWEVRGASVVNNRLEDSRDLVVWYSPGNLIARNTVLRSRYATHFMYSSDCVVSTNHFDGNTVGIFVMYSRDVALRDNEVTNNAAADAMGIGVKESGDITLERNLLSRDRQCLYLDNSPFREGDMVVARSNRFIGCRAGVTFHQSETRTTFEGNRFEANDTPAAIEGRGTARGVVWRGNHFDDYRGFDLDGDGYGDVPYELRDLSERLVARHPELAFFRGTIAFGLVDAAGRLFPLLQPDTLLVDAHPRMR